MRMMQYPYDYRLKWTEKWSYGCLSYQKDIKVIEGLYLVILIWIVGIAYLQMKKQDDFPN